MKWLFVENAGSSNPTFFPYRTVFLFKQNCEKQLFKNFKSKHFLKDRKEKKNTPQKVEDSS